MAAAALLAARGHRVTVHDRFEAPRPVGSGLVIQPVGMEVLRAAGAAADALAMGNPVRRMLGIEADSGRRVLDVSYGSGPEDFGLAIHRASLFDALLSAAQAQGVELVQSAEIAGADAGRLILTDGRTAGPFDLVVDASGVQSRLSPLRSRSLPYGAVWSTVDWPDETSLSPEMLSQRYRRADRMVGVLPIGTMPGGTKPKAAIFWSLPLGGHDAWMDAGLESWRAEATSIWPDFAPFANQVTDPGQMTMAQYSHGTLRRPYAQRFVIIGDAAHRTSPQLGQGANMALLDALALTYALERFPVEEALPVYASARRWHVRFYQGMSAAFTPQYQSDSRWLPVLRDRVLFPISTIPPLPRMLTSLVTGRLLPPLGSLTRRD